jgi:hypothetical protein
VLQIALKDGLKKGTYSERKFRLVLKTKNLNNKEDQMNFVEARTFFGPPDIGS